MLNDHVIAHIHSMHTDTHEFGIFGHGLNVQLIPIQFNKLFDINEYWPTL